MPKEKVADEQVNDVIDDIIIDTDEPENELPDDSKVQIVMSGKTVEVSKDVADAITAERQGMDKKLGETSEELGELRKYQRDTSTRDVVIKDRPDSSVLQKYDYEEGIYSDANAAIAHLKREIIQEMTDTYTADQTQRDSGNKFWDNFWSENHDLARNGVKETAQKRIMDNLPRYSHLPDNKATRDKMADDTRGFFLGIAKNFSGERNADDYNYSEGTSNDRIVTKKVKEEPRKTTAQILKDNRRKKNLALQENK